MRGSVVKKMRLSVQSVFFTNLALSPEVFFSYVLILLLDTRIEVQARGMTDCLLPVLVCRSLLEWLSHVKMWIQFGIR